MTEALKAPARVGLPALGLLALACAAMVIVHIAVGAKPIAFTTVAQALVAPDPTQFDHAVVRNLRLPRALFAATVGAALAVAGALMQGITRNPLAAPGVLGLTMGASFAVVIGGSLAGLTQVAFVPPLAAGGALFAALLVWAIARAVPGGLTVLTLLLAGAAVSTFLGALITLSQLLDAQNYERLRGWLVGTLSGRSMTVFWVVLPWLAAALAGALLIARQITVMAMGEDVATALGLRTGWLRFWALAIVVTLTACAVALAGPLGFIGLVVPHAVRLIVGSDYRWIIPCALLAGATYLLGVDTLARILIAPREIATGILTAMLGAPLFIWLVWSRA
ncbi:iron complex transport system permease protein (plasmid) [Ketogulonicigenium robustum]|uniref:Iron complex transport system permease protein n=1 Tax=Ketogulonicigenium robustum TaxID=92947 RepID=A0A1W6P3F8_9RHOB|nr:iron ABC transporter permease [Ketogulonicigenium robustum]ARO16006.1 iron complex transport system permease protein [Ketogulonicigenium robustum]